MLSQPRAFDITAEDRIGMIFAEALPAMPGRIKVEQFDLVAFRYETMVLVQSDTADGINILRAPEHVSAAVVINKKIRVLKIVKDGRNSLPVT